MASIYREVEIDAPAKDVWDAIRDFGAIHIRVVPGFVTDTKMDGEARIVTFGNGTTAKELLVDCDDAKRRLVYAAVSERIVHHNASVQVIYSGHENCRLIWYADVLPNQIAPYIAAQMDAAAIAMKATLRQSA